MWPMIFCLAAFAALIAAAFIYASSESTAAGEAQIKANEAMASALSAHKQINEIKEALEAEDVAFKKLVELLNERDQANDKMKQKIEWLELKATAPPKHQPPQSLILKQEKPLQVNVLYRESKPVKKLSDEQVRSTVIKNVKKQIQELSK